MKIKINIDVKINRVVKFLILSDLFFLGGWSLIHPFFAIFVINKIEGATLITVSLAAALYWLVKSAFQIPIANYLDKNDGENDDFHILLAALSLAAVASFSFALTKELWQLFLTQLIYAVAMGLYVPSWSGIFSRHLDEKRFSFDWSLDSTAIGVTSAFSALFGGVLINFFGFSAVFTLIGALSLASVILLFFAPNLIFPKINKENVPPIRDHSPSNIQR